MTELAPEGEETMRVNLAASFCLRSEGLTPVVRARLNAIASWQNPNEGVPRTVFESAVLTDCRTPSASWMSKQVCKSSRCSRPRLFFLYRLSFDCSSRHPRLIMNALLLRC